MTGRGATCRPPWAAVPHSGSVPSFHFGAEHASHLGTPSPFIWATSLPSPNSPVLPLGLYLQMVMTCHHNLNFLLSHLCLRLGVNKAWKLLGFLKLALGRRRALLMTPSGIWGFLLCAFYRVSLELCPRGFCPLSFPSFLSIDGLVTSPFRTSCICFSRVVALDLTFTPLYRCAYFLGPSLNCGVPGAHPHILYL